jgi:hypothetical protein
VKSEQLLTQGKIFEDDILAGAEGTNNPAEEVPEPYDHAQNLTGMLPIELGAKSLILRVYDVLMNDRILASKATSLLLSGRGVSRISTVRRSIDPLDLRGFHLVKRITITLCLLLLITLAAGSAFADLNNANVTVNYLYPEIYDIYQVLGTGTVTGAGFTVNSFGYDDYTAYPGEIDLTDVSGSGVYFLPADFNGYGLVVNSGGTPITGVTLLFSDVPGFDLSRVTFDGTDVWLNMQGLATSQGLDIQLGLEFGRTPEPSSLLLLGSGLAAVFAVALKRLR